MVWNSFIISMKMACCIVVLTQPEVLYPQLSSFQMVAPLETTLWFPVSLKVSESRPSPPRYKDIWDVSVVLDYLKTLPPLEELNLKDITHKTVVLVTLLSGQRCQTVHALTISGMRITNDTVHFEIAKLLKTSKPWTLGVEILPSRQMPVL